MLPPFCALVAVNSACPRAGATPKQPIIGAIASFTVAVAHNYVVNRVWYIIQHIYGREEYAFRSLTNAWAAWDDANRYDWIIGSDILYATAMYPHLTRIFESNLAPGGRVLLSDPFRRGSFGFLESLEAAGWNVSIGRWRVGVEGEESPVGVYEWSKRDG